MEQNKRVFEVMCNEDKYLDDVIKWYNNTYKTDFSIVKVTEEIEILFVKIEGSKFKDSDIFNLGFHLGSKEEKLRSEGKIDW